MYIKFADLLFGQLANLSHLQELPKRCYKCNCQRFEPFNSDDDICEICNHDEGEHHQVRIHIKINL